MILLLQAFKNDNIIELVYFLMYYMQDDRRSVIKTYKQEAV